MIISGRLDVLHFFLKEKIITYRKTISELNKSRFTQVCPLVMSAVGARCAMFTEAHAARPRRPVSKHE